MAYMRPAERGPAPGHGWYVLFGAVVVATVMVTGFEGLGRARGLMDEVDAFERFRGSESAVVTVAEPGRYAVYNEWVEREAGNPYASGPPATDDQYGITVTGPDGAQVPVHPIGTSYGWGSRHGDGVAAFDADEVGRYEIRAVGAAGQLAFGRSIPGAPLYGFGGVLAVAGVVIAGCVAGTVLVALRRRSGAMGGAAAGTTAWRAAALTGLGIVAIVGGGLWLAGRQVDADASLVAGGSPSDQPSPPASLECTSDADFETGRCGLTPEELRDINLGYADRLAFDGDLDAANAMADQARTALAPLTQVLPAPSPYDVHAALAIIATDVQVSDNAVRTSGTAFGIAVDGGCVFGSVHDGMVDVEVGGYVNDGGCLASYGH